MHKEKAYSHAAADTRYCQQLAVQLVASSKQKADLKLVTLRRHGLIRKD
jgi:hypothetical protein